MDDTQYRIDFDDACGFSIHCTSGGKEKLAIHAGAETNKTMITSAVELMRNIPLCGGRPLVMLQSVLTEHRIPSLILKPSQHDAPLASIFFLHGFATSKEKLIRYALRFAAAGYACIMPDLPRHGERSDFPFSEDFNLKKNPGDALMKRLAIAKKGAEELPAVIDECLLNKDLDPARIALSGISMGATVALLYAAKDSRIRAAAPFVSVQHFTAMAAAAGIELTNKETLAFDPVVSIKTMPHAAVLLQIGGADREVPPQCGRALDTVLHSLYAQSPDRYRFIEHEGAGHEVTPAMIDEALLFFKKFL